MEVWNFHEYGCLNGGKFRWFWRIILDRVFGGNDDFDKFFYLDELYLFWNLYILLYFTLE